MVNPVRLGFIFGSFVALVHLAWSVLVAGGWAQRFVDFVMWIHFVTPSEHIEAFDFARACILVAVAFSAAFVGATVFGAIWNAFNRA